MGFRLLRICALAVCLSGGVISLRAQLTTFPVPSNLATRDVGSDLDLLIIAPPGQVRGLVAAEFLQLGPMPTLVFADGCGNGGCEMHFYSMDRSGLRLVLDGGGAEEPTLLPSLGAIPDLVFDNLAAKTGDQIDYITYDRYRYGNGVYSLFECEAFLADQQAVLPPGITRVPCDQQNPPSNFVFPRKIAGSVFPKGGAGRTENPSAADLAWAGKAIVARVSPVGESLERNNAVIEMQSSLCDALENCPVYYWPEDARFEKPVLLPVLGGAGAGRRTPTNSFSRGNFPPV
jgi:hypothetical protein